MDHIRTLLPKVLNRRGLMKEATASMIVFRAGEWLARELPGFTDFLFARKFQNGELVVATRHSIAAQECQQRTTDLLHYLQQECGHAEVARIRLIREDPPAPQNAGK